MGTSEIMKVIEFLEDNRNHLNPVQIEFIRSLRKYFDWKGNLSREHLQYVMKIKKKMPSKV